MEAVERLRCCVPFCPRTRASDGKGEWICGPHWRGIPRAVKAAFSKARRTYRKRFGGNHFSEYPPGSPNRLAAVDADHAWRDAWAACKAAAVEAAAGL